MEKDLLSQFSPLTILLHWVIALSILGMLVLGFYMHQAEAYHLYDIHKSIGTLLLLVVLVRIIWRMRNGWPVPVRQHPLMERVLAKANHWLLIIGSLVMPVSGILSSGLGGNGLAVFGLTLIAERPHPTEPHAVIPHNESLAAFFESTHGLVAWLLVGVIALHLVGVLKHHFIDRDATLRRMLGSKVS